MTINGIAVSVVGNTDNTTTRTNLVSALNASTNPYFAAITWGAESGAGFSGTADTAGSPFVAALTVASGTGTVTDFGGVGGDVANSGPCDWNTAANWSLGTIPVATNVVIFADNAVNVAYGLNQNAVTLAELRIEKTYSGLIGLPVNQFASSADGLTAASTSYLEYRAQYLKIGATICNIGQNFSGKSQTGSGRIKIDLQNVASTTTIFETASTGSDANLPPVQLLANSTSVTIETRSGNVGICLGAGEVSSTGAIRVIGGTLTSGPGLTFTTWTTEGGNSSIQYTAFTSIFTYGGVTTVTGTVNASTGVQCLGGTLYWNSSGSLVAAVLNDGGTLSTQQTGIAMTTTTLTIGHCGGTLILNPAGMTGVISFTAPIRGAFSRS